MNTSAVSAQSTASSATQNSKLGKAAQEFEAMLLESLLKESRSMATVEGEKSEGASGSYDDLGTQSVAQAMSAQGGIGIGKLLLAKLGPKAASGGN